MDWLLLLLLLFLLLADDVPQFTTNSSSIKSYRFTFRMGLLEGHSRLIELGTDEENDEDIEIVPRSGKSGVQHESASDPKEETRTGRIGTSGL